MVRHPISIEDIEDIVADLNQALQKALCQKTEHKEEKNMPLIVRRICPPRRKPLGSGKYFYDERYRGAKPGYQAAEVAILSDADKRSNRAAILLLCCLIRPCR